jgi:diguanylate cyclase (GGDEF)-like protein
MVADPPDDPPDSIALSRSATPRKIMVLVVEDDDDVRRLVSRWLSKSQVQTLGASSGEEALQLATTHAESIDAIVLDVMMPGMNGYEVLEHLRKDPSTSVIPVLLSTAHATGEMDLVRSARLGAVDHIAKPFSGPVLAAKVQAAATRGRETRRLHRRLRKAEANALLDPLTHLRNRRAFEEKMRDEVLRTRKAGRELALVVLDIDHFKSVNDTYGHLEGDRVLSHFADQLQEVCPGEAFRHGGEEFVMVLHDSNAQAAVSAVDDLRRQLAAAPLEIGATSYVIHFSAGVSTSRILDEAMVRDAVGQGQLRASDLLFSLADAALYRAKNAGRDCTRVADRSTLVIDFVR